PPAAFTVSATFVLRLRPPPFPVTCTVKEPVAAVAAAVRVSVVEQLVMQLVGLNDAVTPAGSPEAENATLCEAPDTSAAVIVACPELPTCVVTLPEFPTEKSNNGALGVSTILGSKYVPSQ